MALANFWRDEVGATAIEYVMLASFIGMVIVSMSSVLGQALVRRYSEIQSAVAAA